MQFGEQGSCFMAAIPGSLLNGSFMESKRDLSTTDGVYPIGQVFVDFCKLSQAPVRW
jgi:hypothetical protein